MQIVQTLLRCPTSWHDVACDVQSDTGLHHVRLPWEMYFQQRLFMNIRSVMSKSVFTSSFLPTLYLLSEKKPCKTAVLWSMLLKFKSLNYTWTYLTEKMCFQTIKLSFLEAPIDLVLTYCRFHPSKWTKCYSFCYTNSFTGKRKMSIP